MSPIRKSQYDTHFYCALCGGPFAQVFRTPENPAQHCYSNVSDDGAEQSTSQPDPTDLDPKNEFNYSGGDDRIIPEEVVEQDMSYIAARSRKLRLRAQQEGRRKGIMKEPSIVRQAYDGRRISTQQMKWTKNLRALINRKAEQQPLNYENYLQPQTGAYLTGRGLIRQRDTWADAFANIEEDETIEAAEDDEDGDVIAHTEFPVFSDSARARNTFGFQVYKELGPHPNSFITSIPFHDECWTLLDLALEESGLERGLSGMNERLTDDDLWFYLRSLITISGEKQEPHQTFSECRKDAVTRLGDIDYREAQSSGEGWHWKHEDGRHWLVADPSSISVLDEPLKTLPSTRPLPYAPRAALIDKFMDMPAEVILEICSYLTSTDVFCLKTASPAVLNIALPDSYYRRFLREEFKYLPKLKHEITKYELDIRERRGCNIDWRGSFERLRFLMRTPNVSHDIDHPDYGKEWDEVDIGLKNRRRIWKIVKPIAETLVEQSIYALEQLHEAPIRNTKSTSVVRGYVGTRSGKEGSTHTAYFGPRAERPLISSSPDSAIYIENEECGEIQIEIKSIRFWCDIKTGNFCGMQFNIIDPIRGTEYRKFGREGGNHYEELVRNKILAGFAFCVADGIITGAQLFHYGYNSPEDLSYADGSPIPESKKTEFGRRIGNWNGIIRKVVVKSSWRNLVGVTGFLNSTGFIETIALIEECKNTKDDGQQFGPLARPSCTVPLTHEEASLWRDRLIPADVAVHEREGPAIPEWQMTGADWEIWESKWHEDGVENEHRRKRTLVKMTGYYDKKFLRGLEFTYIEDKSGARITSLMGFRDGDMQSSIEVNPTETLVAAVISFGDEAVNGILFVTDHSAISDVFGPRYVGTHKVFAPPPNHELSSRGATKTAYHREEINSRIVGLHALYDYEERKFLQLGLILPQEDLSFNLYGICLTCDIPFDKPNDQAGLWDTGPPPDEWTIGSSDVFAECEAYFPKMRQGSNDYSGWAKLESLREVTIYRNFMGIKFSYTNSDKEIYFGSIGNESDISLVQTFDPEGGEKIIGFATIEADEEDTNAKPFDDEISIISATSRYESKPLKRLYFLTNHNKDESPYLNKVGSTGKYLCGIKFDFNFNQILSYAPIFDLTEVKNKPDKYANLCDKIRLPWKKLDKSINSDPGIPIPKTAKTIAISFRENELGRIDAVKGYARSNGRFCGLLFRRNGRWSNDAFGERSPHEITFEIGKDEYFDSLFLPEHESGFLGFEAIALSTNLGNTTPWIGKTDGIPRHRKAPPECVGIGLFAAQEEEESPRWQQEEYRSDLVGLLYRTSRPGEKEPRVPETRKKPLPTQYFCRDPETNLRWLNDFQSRDESITLSLGNYGKPRYYREDRKDLGRAFLVFDPSQLLQVRVWCGTGPGVRGILGIRFRGTPAMGIVTAGDWPDEKNKKLTSAEKINIAGPDGERLVKIKLAFQRLAEQEDKIIGLAIETSFGRTKTIVSSSLCPEKPIDLNSSNVKILECPGDKEIVGLNGIYGTYQIHDLGLALRKKPQLQNTITSN
ncbi:hypothetical protein EDC01DRAFT_121523 [Geopyxis carbonaria]|nr:hypothetical protein EDC01DRAFT_121523 [Geopyxis carbonaria]